MSPAKRLLAGIMIALSLTLSGPALAAESSIFNQAQTNLVKGAHFYAQTIGGWFVGLSNAFQRLIAGVGRARELGEPCEAQSHCQITLACVNACPDGQSDCDVAVKRCALRPNNLRVVSQNGSCTFSDFCVSGTVCTRVCPAGVKCDEDRLCLPSAITGQTCSKNSDCREACAGRTSLSIGETAFAPTCENNACLCRPIQIDSRLTRVACQEALASMLVCPYGTSPGCTLEGCASGTCAKQRVTCLTAPEFGGKCFDQDDCAKAGCPTGSSPVCTQNVCKCLSTQAETLQCKADDDCSSISCEPGQVKACVKGKCACGLQVQAEQASCQTVSDCQGDCPTSYSLACVNQRCACQRTVQGASVKCVDVADCGAVSCPSDYVKTCHNGTCACARN